MTTEILAPAATVTESARKGISRQRRAATQQAAQVSDQVHQQTMAEQQPEPDQETASQE